MSLNKVLAAVAAAASLQGVALAQETVKVGLLNVESGPMAVYARSVADGAAFAIETLNAQGGVLGRKYELVTQTHIGTPAAAVAAASRLAEQMGAPLMSGFNTSSFAMAISPKLVGLNALLLDSTAAADDLTGKLCNKNYFRVAASDSMLMQAIRAVVKQSGIKSWDLLMADYAAGHDFGKKYAALVQEGGGTVQASLFAPLTTTDFGSYITQLGAKPAEGLAVMYPGAGAIALAKQQQQFGLFGKYKYVMTAYFTNDTLVGAQGDTTVGSYGVQTYQWQIPGERNAAFVKAFEAKYKRKPTYLDGDVFASYEILHAAITKAKSTDVAAVRAALEGLKASTIVGEVEMRAGDHQLLRGLPFTQVVKAGDGKGEVVMKAFQPASVVTAPMSPECKM